MSGCTMKPCKTFALLSDATHGLVWRFPPFFPQLSTLKVTAPPAAPLLHEIHACFVNTSALITPVHIFPHPRSCGVCRSAGTCLPSSYFTSVFVQLRKKKKRNSAALTGSCLWFWFQYLGDVCVTTSHGRHVAAAFLAIKTSLLRAVSPKCSVLLEWDQPQIITALIFNRYRDATGC